LKHLILKKKISKNENIQLDGKDFHYLVHVRRLAAGECFPALLPDGEEVLIKIISIKNNILTGELSIDPISSSASPHLCENNSRIILFQAIPKGDKMDLIARQAAESGVAQIVPFTAEFSIGGGEVGEQKFSRWERIIKEARQQSGSKTATNLHQPLSINALIDYWKILKNKNTLGLLFHHEKGVEQNSLHEYLNSNPENIVLVVGPEGGFSGKEVSFFLENEFKAVTIGDTVLRTETAALYFTAAVRTILLEKNSWELKQT